MSALPSTSTGKPVKPGSWRKLIRNLRVLSEACHDSPVFLDSILAREGSKLRISPGSCSGVTAGSPGTGSKSKK